MCCGTGSIKTDQRHGIQIQYYVFISDVRLSIPDTTKMEFKVMKLKFAADECVCYCSIAEAMRLFPHPVDGDKGKFTETVDGVF
jgi:hypothetical protein